MSQCFYYYAIFTAGNSQIKIGDLNQQQKTNTCTSQLCMYVCMINRAKMSHVGLNMLFLSAGTDSGLHCVLLNSEHAIPDLSHTHQQSTSSPPLQSVYSFRCTFLPKILALTDFIICYYSWHRSQHKEGGTRTWTHLFIYEKAMTTVWSF